MPRPKSPTLTEAELPIMETLWEHGELPVREVVEALPGRSAYNTVLTILQILERKGYVRHRREGRAFVYRPVVGREQARSSALRHVLKRFFESSPEALVVTLLESERIDDDELARLKALVEESERKGKP